MENLEYNTQRPQLPLPEYGRNLHKMVDRVVKTNDREKRTQYAHQLIEIMVQLHATAKDSPELRHKLWDHLFIMSDFKLDVDSPFPVPDRQVLTKSPKHLSYPKGAMKYNYYGRNIQEIIEKVAEMEDGTEKETLIKNIANQLKKSYLIWNRDSVDDTVIAKHLEEMSKNRLRISEDLQLKHTNEILNQQGVKKKPKRSSKSQGQRRKNKYNNQQG
ncbi:MAG TPA: DUF4290 domain-containing protein [Bacteroidales bacterium]|nr:DUF4290 domain-containing protein [Bacteroidales bacterium]